MGIANYNELLKAARHQSEPQRMLFVFARSELPEEHDSVQAQRFHAGQGGVLVPVMSVDKSLEELGDFSDLVAESQQMGQHWQIVFVAALAGRNGVLPGAAEAQATMDMMVKSVQQGVLSNFLAYDRDGNQMHFY